MPREYRFLSAKDLAALPPQAWQVDGLVAENSVVWLAGQSGAGKSFLALLLAHCIALGRPFAGRATKPGAVLYLAAEGGAGIWPRMAALLEHFGVTDAPVYVLPFPLFLAQPEEVEAFLKAAAEFFPGGVFVDTYGRSVPGLNDNNREDFSLAFAAIERVRRELQTTVYVIDHSNKPNSEGKVGAGPGGSGQKYASADTVLEVRCKGKLSRGDAVVLEVLKLKDGAEPPAIHFRPTPCGDSLVLVHDDGAESAASESLSSESYRLALRVLAELTADGEPVLVSKWERCFAEAGGTRATFYRIRPKLVQQRLVEQRDAGRNRYYLPTPGGLSLTEVSPRSHDTPAFEVSQVSHSKESETVRPRVDLAA